MCYNKSDMKNWVRLFVIFLLSLFLTSCVDYVQSISYSKGKYKMYYKVTLSKVLFAMVDEDPEELFEDFDEEALNGLPGNVDVKPVNTDLEVGAEFTIMIDPRTANDDEKILLPKIAGNKCFIPFLLGDNKSISDSVKSKDSDGEAFTEAFLSSSKCRVLISKNVLSSIETAYFEGKCSQNYSIPIFDYGDNYCLEIPFIVLCQEGMYRTDRIVIIKK